VNGANDLDELRVAALHAMEQAYAPYSRFRVGAALRAADGSVSVGCNVENASFPVGLCAERGALAAAVSAGHRAFDVLMVVTESDEPPSPCGMCRQALVEFAPGLHVVSLTTAGRRADWTLASLLPEPFSPASLTSMTDAPGGSR
jgi:cytidine deaminase